MNPEKVIIRKAVVDDAYGMVFVNAHTRYTTYQWLMPQEALEQRIQTNSINEKAQKMAERIANQTYTHFVAEDTETHKVVGMCTYGPSRNDKYPESWEIMSLYLLKPYQKYGIWKRLFLAGVKELINLWYHDMIINVVKGNDTINFYKKYGGKEVEEISKPRKLLDGFILHEWVLYFDNIEAIK